jgi:hypothetical protein
MGIEGSGTPGGMLKRMSFDDQDARRPRPYGRFMASRAQYGGRTVGVDGFDFVFEP